MPAGYIPLPRYDTGNAMLDFSGLNQGIGAIREQGNQNRKFGILEKQDARDAEKFGMEKQKIQMAMAERERQKAALAGLAQAPEFNAMSSAAKGYYLSSPEMAGNYLTAHQKQKMELSDPTNTLRRQLLEAQVAQAKQKEDPSRAYRLREEEAARAGLQPGSPQYQSYVLQGKVGRDEPLSAGDRKAIRDAEGEIPAIDGTISSLDSALSLNDKTYSGYGAQTRGYLGSKLPDWAVPDFVAEPKKSAATSEFTNIISLEAAKQMAETLKGATTDRELAFFVTKLGDPSTPAPERAKILTRMRRLAQDKRQLSTDQSNDIRGGTYYRQNYRSGPQGAPPQAGQPGQPQPQAAKTINGVNYIQIDGQWFEQ